MVPGIFQITCFDFELISICILPFFTRQNMIIFKLLKDEELGLKSP